MAGFDAIVFRGTAAAPVYLWIEDGRYALRDASAYWGMGTGRFEDTIKTDLGDDKLQTMTIGRAGENLVKFASPITFTSRAAGRSTVSPTTTSTGLPSQSIRRLAAVKSCGRVAT